MKYLSNAITVITLITMIFSCSVQPKNTEKEKKYLLLAQKLIEVDDSEQLTDFAFKLEEYRKNPKSVFKGDEYYYDTENNKFQAYRGNGEELSKNTYWFLLIDNLEFGHYLLEFDWKADYKTLEWGLNFMSDKKKYTLPKIPNEEELTGNTLDDIFPQINAKLNENNLVLINLYIDSDSYVTGLIKKDNLNEISTIAQELGHEIEEYK